jgi:segregation and condensation protein B
VDGGAVLKLLLERDLVKIVGRKDEPGRPLLYGTTVNFLEFFNMMGLSDLPDLAEFRELSAETKTALQFKTGMDPADAELLGQEMLDFAARAQLDDLDDLDELDETDLAAEAEPAGPVGAGEPEA